MLANLLLEGTLHIVDCRYTPDATGMSHLIKDFAWHGRFSTHTTGEIPGCINEGGELGYALAAAFGAVMDNPDLIVACLVGGKHLRHSF